MNDNIPLVSVIIPTHNRREALLRTLASLTTQTLPPDQFEVIVVDDGCSDGTDVVVQRQFPYPLVYVRQANQGATVARNQGARRSRGMTLVFLDDDITASPNSLEVLAAECRDGSSIVLGTLVAPDDARSSVFAWITACQGEELPAEDQTLSVHFTECKTGLLAVRRSDFLTLGMFQDPTGGWPNWDDVDFGCRAHMHGFALLRTTKAVGMHWDYSLVSLAAHCRRSYQASKAAVSLFQRYPGLERCLPMFYDMTPVNWSQDSVRLIGRKMARRAASLQPMVSALEILAHLLERRWPRPGLLRPLYRWIHGSYIFDGYCEGLRELAAAGAKGSQSRPSALRPAASLSRGDTRSMGGLES